MKLVEQWLEFGSCLILLSILCSMILMFIYLCNRALNMTPPSRQTVSPPPRVAVCSLCWSSIILLLLPYPLLAPLYPHVCYTHHTHTHYHLVRLTGFGEGDGGGPAGGTPALKAPLIIARAAGSLCYRWTHVPLLEKRETCTISESARINLPGWAFDLAGNGEAHHLCLYG